MNEKANFKDFAPASQTLDESILEQNIAQLRLKRAFGKEIDQAELDGMKGMQELFANRPASGDYNEHVDVEAKDPIKDGLFPGDVFFKKVTQKTRVMGELKDKDGNVVHTYKKSTYKEGSNFTRVPEYQEEVVSEVVYAVTARREIGGQAFVLLKTETKNGDIEEIVSEDEARKLLSGAELVDSGIDRENARFSNQSEVVNSDVDNESEPVGESTGESAKVLTEEDDKYASMFADTTALDRLNMLNLINGNKEVSRVGDGAIKDLEYLDSLKGKEAADFIHKAIEKGFVLSKDGDVEFKSSLDTPKLAQAYSVDSSEQESGVSASGSKNFDPSSLSDEAKERRKRDIIALFKNASDDDISKMFQLAYGDDLETKLDDLEKRGIHTSKDLLNEESQDELVELINSATAKGFRFNVNQKESSLSQEEREDATFLNMYREIAEDPKELAKLLRKVYGNKWKKQTTIEKAQGWSDTDAVEVMRQAISEGYDAPELSVSDIDDSEEAEVDDSSSPATRRFTASSAYDTSDTELIGVADYQDTDSSEVVSEKKNNKSSAKLRKWGRGILAASFLGLGIGGALVLGQGEEVQAKDVPVAEALAPAPTVNSDDSIRIVSEQLKDVPVRDGSGGYELLNTLSQKLDVPISEEVWDQHQREFAQMFPQYTYDMGNGQIGLLDTDLNTNASRYDLSMMGKMVSSWNQPR
ncbi:MAG: hypothetical protein WAW80_02565 [Candidatus Saccharimonadales bacterium]